MDHQKLLEIGRKKRNGELTESWDSLAKGTSFTNGDAFRNWVKRRVKGQLSEEPTFKETVEIHNDGMHSSNKLLRMSIDEAKDPAYLLKAHGYDRDAWELVSARSNIWNAHSDKSGIMQLYSSKISVKPRKSVTTIDDVIAAIKDIKPFTIDIKPIVVAGKGLLEIPIFDAHFGISDYEYYKPSQDQIALKLMAGYWQEALFIIGQDLFHNDGFRGQTANGTQIETVDMAKAWNDALKFYSPLIAISLQRAKKVKIIYSKGNHCESISWAFVQMLKALFPQAAFDDGMEERKSHVYGSNFIGITHGDKARKNLHNIFPIEFPVEWSQAKNREIHTGHYHIEDGKDVFGMMIRTLSTRNKTDKWHKDNGFVGGHKRFMLFEYSKEELESIHYV